MSAPLELRSGAQLSMASDSVPTTDGVIQRSTTRSISIKHDHEDQGRID